MEDHNYLMYASLSILFLLSALKLLRRSTRARRNLPPSPPSLPVIGHLHHLKLPVHRSFHKLSAKYGPIISLRFGSRPVVILSSSPAVEECFAENDVVLANRPLLLITKHLGYNGTTVTASPYGDHWRNLRRIGAIEIFSSSRLNKFTDIRSDEVERLLRKLSRDSLHGFSKVHLQSSLMELTFNIAMRMAAGKRYFGDDAMEEEEGRKFRKLMKDITALGGVSNPGDFIPILNWICNGFERKVKELGKKMDAFLQGLINEHRNNDEQGRNTMIDHLLSLQKSEPAQYGDQIIKGFILVLLLAGTDTAAVTMEWAMSHLLNNPETLKKAREELDSQVGQDRLVQESDVPRLHYIQNIISETLRMNPAAPLLVPHFASRDCKICGYDVAGGTIVLVNAWAVHRDPSQWEDPMCFKPERFGKSEAEAHKLVAFGVGRRACPGSGMAQRVMGLTLAAVIQCFEWERVGEEDVDMAEGRGATMPKAVPLEAMCRARPVISKLVGA